MPLIAMNREMGSLGLEVATGLAQALGMKIRHHEIIDHLANRARVRRSHVMSFLDGALGLLDGLTIDKRRLSILTADEILSIADSGEPVILRGWGATSLLKDVPHAVRVCVSASRRTRVKRMMERLDTNEQAQVERFVDLNDEAAHAVMRRHFHIDTRDINEYDIGFNTDRMSVDECVDEVAKMVKSNRFAETDESRRKLHEVALAHHVRAAIRTHSATQHAKVKVTVQDGEVTLDGIADDIETAESCVSIAQRLQGVKLVVNRMQVGKY